MYPRSSYPIGASSSGKTQVFGTCIRRFESSRPSFLLSYLALQRFGSVETNHVRCIGGGKAGWTCDSSQDVRIHTWPRVSLGIWALRLAALKCPTLVTGKSLYKFRRIFAGRMYF